MQPSEPVENQPQQPIEGETAASGGPAAPAPPVEASPVPGAAAELPAPPPRPAGPLPGERPLALLEIFVVSGILTDLLAVLLAGWLTGLGREGVHAQPHGLFVFLMISTVFILGAAALFQRLHRGNPALHLRFRPAAGLLRELAAMAACVPVVFVTLWAAELAIMLVDPKAIQQINPILAMIRTPSDLALFMVSGVIAGGVREEVQRAFIIRRAAVYFWSPWVGLLLWSVVFGLAHAPQGPAAIVITALLGLEFGIFYLWRGTLAVPVGVHSLFNVAVLVVYWLTR